MGAVLAGGSRQLLVSAVGLLHQHHAGCVIFAGHGEGVALAQLPASRGSGDLDLRRICGSSGLEGGHTVHGGAVHAAVADLNVRLGRAGQGHRLSGQRVIAHIGTVGIDCLNAAVSCVTICHQLRHITLHAVSQKRHNLTAFSCIIAIVALGHLRHFLDHQLFDRAGQGNQVAAVVLEVQCAVLIHHGAADAVLRQGALRLEHHGCAVALTVFGDAVLQSCLTRAVVDHAHDAGGVVIHEVDVHAAILGVGGQQAAGLGITLSGGGVCHAPAVQIQHRDVVAAVGGELAVARHANIGAVVIHHGGGGAHTETIETEGDASLKFATLFVDKLDINSSSLVSGGGTFSTKDGMNWKLSDNGFNSKASSTAAATLVVDVNGTDAPNCGQSTTSNVDLSDGATLEDSTKCAARTSGFDRFTMSIYQDGRITVSDSWAQSAIKINKDVTE